MMSKKGSPDAKGWGRVFGFFLLGAISGHVLFKRIERSLDEAACGSAKLPPILVRHNNAVQVNSALSAKRSMKSSLFANGIFSWQQDSEGAVEGERGAAEEERLPRDEVGDNFLFIGIMTARKYLDTRAMASNKTWVPRVPGKVVYFLGEGETYTGDLNVAILSGVKENDYPPQKKSFAMVEYINEHYAKDYQWIIRADDDVYMRVDELVKFLKSINDTTPRYVGQPGFGKPIEQGKLGLSGAFCMGGPGVIMTSKVVQGVSPALKECLKVTVTGHEDTELGRCITISTGVQCTTAFEMKTLFYQNYQELDLPNSSFKKKLGSDELKAITLHPLKEPSYVFRLENFFNVNQLKEMEAKKRSLMSDLRRLNKMLDEDKKKVSLDKIGVSPTSEVDVEADSFFQEARSRRLDEGVVNLDHIEMLPESKSIYHGSDKSWEFIKYKRMFSTTIETGKLEFPTEYRHRAHLHQTFVQTIKGFPDFKKTPPQFVNETYQRLTASRGAESLLFLKRWKGKDKFVQPLYMRRPFHNNLVDFREGDALDEDIGKQGKDIYMLMPLYQRSSIYKRFLDMFSKVLKDYSGKIQLRVVLFTDERGEHKLISAATYAMMGQHSGLDIRINYIDEPFNRGKGLMAAQADLPHGSLLLFMDVDMEFSPQFLYRVSKYTVQGRSAFFPIYFVHYNPESICYKQEDCDTLLNSRRDEVGLWRSFSYGIGAVYKKDLVKAGGFKTDIKGWGLEDVDFFERCLNASLMLVRGSDAGMIHRYHPRECDTTLPEKQLTQCQDSGNAMLGSVANLYTMLGDVSGGTELRD
ncbi:chondroitin sulfate synthase 1 [Aplysia californica]|uniref:Hexosyltransferase n=1 Tax=Aplysia californica TaxID=6500 RepID=A0ABM0K9I3_APLCA|nr:chondroitin sulfate synthase 1 [Aplysia californica]